MMIASPPGSGKRRAAALALVAVVLFCACSLAGRFALTALGVLDDPHAKKPDSSYTMVDINTVVGEHLANPADADAGVSYLDYVGAYGYVGGWRKNLLGIVWVTVYGDESLSGYYFDCGLNENKQTEGLSVGDYVYIQGQVGGNGKSATIWDEYFTLVYCYLTPAAP